MNLSLEMYTHVNDIILHAVYLSRMTSYKAGGYYRSKLFTMNNIDYYTCWEDFQIIQKALQINNADVIFSITSGGCNIFNFLVYNPKKIIAVDYNPYQNHLLELKIEAMRQFEYEQFLQFMGITPSNDREQLYERVRKRLSDNARKLWDRNSYAIKRGVLLVGEQNVKNIGKMLRFLKGHSTIENFFLCGDIKEQTAYFYDHINGLPWRLYQRSTSQNWVVKLMLCSRAIKELPYRRKRAPDYFHYLQHVHFLSNHAKRIEQVFSKIPIRYNHFASLMLLGYYFNTDCYPPYLKVENYDTIRQRLDRIEMKSASAIEAVRQFPHNYFTKFNLSNIFDWMGTDSFHQQLEDLTNSGKDGGKILYATTRTDREIPPKITALSQDAKLASELLHEDRTIMYSMYHFGTIRK
jgi:S-adenosylmethionine-diacylglycerol 3-amino-3-carboxypropyl transferase